MKNTRRILSLFLALFLCAGILSPAAIGKSAQVTLSIREMHRTGEKSGIFKIYTDRPGILYYTYGPGDGHNNPPSAESGTWHEIPYVGGEGSVSLENFPNNETLIWFYLKDGDGNTSSLEDTWYPLMSDYLYPKPYSLAGGGEITLHSTVDFTEVSGFFRETGEGDSDAHEKISATGSGKTWKATLPNLPGEYVFSGTLGDGSAIDCVVTVTQKRTGEFVSDGLRYVFCDGGVSLAGAEVGKDTPKKLIVPAYVTFEGTEFPVVSVKEMAFQENRILTHVTLPHTVQVIESFAFSGCSSLEKVTVKDFLFAPSQLKAIESASFQSCSGLTKINLPESLTSLGTLSFAYCGLTEITLPANINFIDANVFLQTPLNTVYAEYYGASFSASSWQKNFPNTTIAPIPRWDATAQNLRWDGKTARWDGVPEASKYLIALYEEGRNDVLTEAEVSELSYSFSRFTSFSDRNLYFSVTPIRGDGVSGRGAGSPVTVCKAPITGFQDYQKATTVLTSENGETVPVSALVKGNVALTDDILPFAGGSLDLSGEAFKEVTSVAISKSAVENGLKQSGTVASAPVLSVTFAGGSVAMDKEALSSLSEHVGEWEHLTLYAAGETYQPSENGDVFSDQTPVAKIQTLLDGGVFTEEQLKDWGILYKGRPTEDLTWGEWKFVCNFLTVDIVKTVKDRCFRLFYPQYAARIYMWTEEFRSNDNLQINKKVPYLTSREIEKKLTAAGADLEHLCLHHLRQVDFTPEELSTLMLHCEAQIGQNDANEVHLALKEWAETFLHTKTKLPEDLKQHLSLEQISRFSDNDISVAQMLMTGPDRETLQHMTIAAQTVIKDWDGLSSTKYQGMNLKEWTEVRNLLQKSIGTAELRYPYETAVGSIRVNFGASQVDAQTGTLTETQSLVAAGTLNYSLPWGENLSEKALTLRGYKVESDGTLSFRPAVLSTEGKAPCITLISNSNSEYIFTVESGYEVCFSPENGEDPFPLQTDEAGKLALLPKPEKKGYRFIGWFDAQTEGNPISPDTALSGPVTLYGRWEKDYTPILWWSLGIVGGLAVVGAGVWIFTACKKKRKTSVAAE